MSPTGDATAGGHETTIMTGNARSPPTRDAQDLRSIAP
jgi:hypothetical protein